MTESDFTIGDSFNRTAVKYHTLRRKYINCFDLFYGTLLDLLPRELDEASRVLDLGAGTGLVAELVRGQFPECCIDLQDVAEGMLAQAKQRLGENDKTRYLYGDYLRQPLPEGYDVIVSALSLHHCSAAQLNMVFSKIFRSLKPGGVFINADQHLGINAQMEDIFHAQWLSKASVNGCTSQELDEALDRMKFDKTQPLSVQLNLLEAKGFEQVHCWFKYFRYCVYSGVKP